MMQGTAFFYPINFFVGLDEINKFNFCFFFFLFTHSMVSCSNEVKTIRKSDEKSLKKIQGLQPRLQQHLSLLGNRESPRDYPGIVKRNMHAMASGQCQNLTWRMKRIKMCLQIFLQITTLCANKNTLLYLNTAGRSSR